MKRILIAAVAIIGLAFSAKAQLPSYSNSNLPVRYTSLDTVTNTGSKTYTAAVANARNSVTFQLNFLKISGTTTSTYATLSGSLDGTNYVALFIDTMAAASRNYIHAIEGNPYTKYTWTIQGAGTQSSSYRSYILLR